MSPMLHQSRGVHRAHEHRQEHKPVIQRRAVDVVRKHGHGGAAHKKLNESLHALSYLASLGTYSAGRLCHGAVHGPTKVLGALPHRANRDTRFARPLRDRLGAPLVGQENIGPSIVGLLPSGGPPAIRGGVGAIVVDALKSHTRGAFSHIHHKRGKIFPARIDHNSAPAIVRKRGLAGIVAARSHVGPKIVERMVFPLSGQAVLDASAGLLVFQTAARDLPSAAKGGASHNSSLSAIAAARPQICAVPPPSDSQNCQPSEALAGQINHLWHKALCRNIRGIANAQ